MSDIEIITLIGGIFGIIVGTVSIIFYFFSYRLNKRENEKKVIIDIIENFIFPTDLKLLTDKFNSKGFDFPKSLTLSYGISIEDRSFKRFSKRKHFFAWKIVTAPRDKSRGFTPPVVLELDNHQERIVAVVDF